MFSTRMRAAVVTAALLALALAAPAAAEAPKGGPDLRYAPDNANVLMVLRMDQLIASDGFKKLRKEIPELDKEFDSGFRKEFGFDTTNVEQMMRAAAVKNDPPLGAFHLKKGVDVKDVLKAREGLRGKHKEEKVGAVTLYVPERDADDAFCLPNDRTLLFGPAKTLKAVLERNKKAAVSDAVTAALKEADPAATLTVVMDVKAVFESDPPPEIPGVDFDKIKAGATGAALTVKVGTDVALRAAAVCKDAKAAEEVKTQAEALQKAGMEMMKKAPPGAVPKDVLELPGKIKFATKGNLAEATLTVPADTAIAFLKAMLVPVKGQSTKPPEGEKKPPEKKP
jgi:hypothetical protein